MKCPNLTSLSLRYFSTLLSLLEEKNTNVTFPSNDILMYIFVFVERCIWINIKDFKRGFEFKLFIHFSLLVDLQLLLKDYFTLLFISHLVITKLRVHKVKWIVSITNYFFLRLNWLKLFLYFKSWDSYIFVLFSSLSFLLLLFRKITRWHIIWFRIKIRNKTIQLCKYWFYMYVETDLIK